MKPIHLLRASAVAAILLLQFLPFASKSRAAAGDLDSSFDPGPAGWRDVVSAIAVQPAVNGTLLAALSAGAQPPCDTAKPALTIPIDQLGAVAGKQYDGDGMSITATPDGARLRCAFQCLEGDVTTAGLWLSSTANGAKGERFRVVAIGVERELDVRRSRDNSEVSRPAAGDFNQRAAPLALTGSVTVEGRFVRFIRVGLTEEYSVSMDGVRQDFIVDRRLEGEGELRVELELTGAKAEALSKGVRLVLADSGRKLAYNRLRVVDARGQELAARMEVSGATRLTVVVNDAAAVYPVRIDPTFSDADWSSMGGIPGADDIVRAAVTDSSGNLYIGGDFVVAGEVFVNRIAKWDGNAWSALGAGMDGSVQALAVLGTELYAGGAFTTAGGVAASHVARWDGEVWSALGAGMDSDVHALAVSGADLYAGGDFTTAGGTAAASIAKWNGSAWSALGAGTNDSVYALAVIGSNLYAGGNFSMAGGITAESIAKWNGGSWSPLGSGLKNGLNPPIVYALAVSGTDLYAGGNFSTADGAAANHLAKWNGNAWSALGRGMEDDVHALAVSGTKLYAIGRLSTGDWTTTSSLAQWNGSAWSVVGPWADNDDVHAIVVVGTELFAGGDFYTAAGTPANNIANWNGSAWSACGLGMNSSIFALAVIGTDLYAGGNFTRAGTTAANYIAKWNGSAWSPLGSGLDGPVSALAVLGADLYAGGYFRSAGGTAVQAIARWNGNAWSSLGTRGGLGEYANVTAMAIVGTDLYAGGDFTTATQSAFDHIARWNGTAWSALGSGVDGPVIALAAMGTHLYAGGYFRSASGTAANSIAKWNGSAWSSLGSGIDGEVHALAVSGTNLYASGYIAMAGGMEVNHIAKWSGSAWSPLGAGLNGDVSALAAVGSDLYAGGNFSTAGGTEAHRIAKWDGSTWSALGSGIDGGPYAAVYALAPVGTDLYAGGNFSTAGNKVSAYAVSANIGALENLAPTVRISSPAEGATYAGPATIEVNVDASDSDGTVAKVEFYVGQTLLASDTAEPFTMSWKNVPVGNYSLIAEATDNLGEKGASAPVNISVTSPASPPLAPSGLTARAISTGRIKLRWIDNATDETSYKIERAVNGKPFREIAQVGADFVFFIDRGLASGKRYSYRVRASNADGDSLYSNAAKARTLP